MSTSILTGSVFPDPAKQQPYEYGRTERGRYAKVPYESVSQSQIDAMAANCDALGLNYTMTNSFGKARIVIDYPYNYANSSFPNTSTESEQVWEITPGNSTKDLLDSNNPQVLAVLATTNGPQEIQLLKNWQRTSQLEQNLTNTDQSSASYGEFVQPVIKAGTNFSNAGTILAKFIYDGVSTVPIKAPILTHTSTVTLNYINPAEFINCNLIYSTATLISTESIPSGILFGFTGLPTSDPSPIPIGATGLYQVLLYGWLKNSPTVRQAGQRKWTITQTYEFGLWGIALFGGTRL